MMDQHNCRFPIVLPSLPCRWFVSLLLILTTNDIRNHVDACTNILVTPGASLDGSAMIAYNADSPVLMGMLYHYPARNNISSLYENDTTTTTTTSTKTEQRPRKIYDWDSGRYLGTIMEDMTIPTYNVVGNTNEYGLVIGETTFGGVSILAWNQTNGILDYGSLIYMTLQQCQTVSCAIHTMTTLMDTYGYVSGGESFSFADRITGEVWMMEVISRGNDYQNGKLGAVWVAQRIPDGMVAAHANHARITTFPRHDPNNCLYAKDVIDVAIYYGLYSIHDDPLLFSFSDVYDPLSFLNVRQGEARVWSIFSQMADPDGIFQTKYESYALGYENTTEKTRMPLYIKPYKQLSLQDIGHFMSSHYENTRIDPTKDVGSGLFGSPYRPRPLEWTYQNQHYFNERTIAIEKTGWNFIGQIRMNMPLVLSTIIWFACDDSSTSPRVPIYSASTRLPKAYYLGPGSQDGVKQPLLQFDVNQAFWIQNMVSNLAYSRWNDIYPMVQAKIIAIQDGFEQNIQIVDERALEMYHNHQIQDSIEYVTFYSVNAGNTLQTIWMKFYGELFAKFRDYYTIVSKENDLGCEAIEPGLSDIMKQRIVQETGDHYRVPQQTYHPGNVGVYPGEHGPPKTKQYATTNHMASKMDSDDGKPNEQTIEMVRQNV
jgi:dipeptidase